MINKNLKFALIGASNNPAKYGNKVFLDLLSSGYSVIPVNPKEDIIAEKKAYKSLSDINDVVDFVIFVVQPAVTEKVLEEVLSLGIKNVWMQPGSESEKALEFCKKNKVSVVANSCIMIEKNKKIT